MARGPLLALLLAALTAAMPLPATAGPMKHSVRASAGELLQLAEQLVRAGDRTRAKAALAALAADPSADVRNESRFRLAKLLEADGLTRRAAILLRQILDDKPGAVPVRLELARLLDRMGAKEEAWREMRAIHASGLPPDVARLVDRYSEALRAQRPFGVSFEIAIAPDSNINRGTRSDVLGTVFGNFDIAEEGKAKSGTGLSMHAQAYRRLPVGDSDASVLMRLSGSADLYRHKEFNDIAFDVAVGPELNLHRNRLQLELGATQRWFGQKSFMRSWRAAATLSHPMGNLTLLRLSGSAALVDNLRNDLQDGKTFSGDIGIEHAMTATIGVAASVGIDRQSLKDPGYSTTGWRIGLRAWHDMGRMTLSGSVDVGKLQADERLLLFPHKRLDHYSRFMVGAAFRQLQLHGFAPIIRFAVERNRSNVEFYDHRRTRTEIGVVRAF